MGVVQKFKQDPNSTIKYSIRWGAPAWAISTGYVVDDCVFDERDATYYRCIWKHTSDGSSIQTDIDQGYWSRIKEGLYLSGLTGEKVAAAPIAVWTVPAPLTLDAQSQDEWTTTILIVGGGGAPTSPPTEYAVSCKIVTDQNPDEIIERSIGIVLDER
jgi:hypothetical protein